MKKNKRALMIEEELEKAASSPDYAEWRFDSPLTFLLKRYADAFRDIQRTRKGLEQRGTRSEGLLVEEEATSRFLAAALQQHPLWPFLEPLTGLTGALAARVIGEIGHPGRFPGQQCANGHYLVSMFEPSTMCPALVWEEREDGGRAEKRIICGAVIQSPRIKQDMTGVRSVYHFAGLHTVSECCGWKRDYDGRCEHCGQESKGVSPALFRLKEPDGSYRKRDWNPKLRALILQPKGVGEQIVNHKPEPYYSAHPTNSYMAKLRHKAAEAGVAMDAAKDAKGKTPVELIRAKGIARKVAAKLWLGDLFVFWKRALEEAQENVA